jgi:hypothetical protein
MPFGQHSETDVDTLQDLDFAAFGHLNRTYDALVARFGPINSRENVRAFIDDPDRPLLQSLEEFDTRPNWRGKPPFSNGVRWSGIGQLNGSKLHQKPFLYRSMKPARSIGPAWNN